MLGEITSTVRWDSEECYQYIVETLGKREQLPGRYDMEHGTEEMLARLEIRYGSDYISQFKTLLEHHLGEHGTSESDKSLWRAWRADFEITGVSTTPFLSSAQRLALYLRASSLGVYHPGTARCDEGASHVMEFWWYRRNRSSIMSNFKTMLFSRGAGD